MATEIKLRRGTTAEHDDGSGFTGAVGEVTIDTTIDTIRVHDNSTKGGHRLAKYSELGGNITAVDESSDATSFPIFTTAATGSLAPKTDASAYTYNASNGTLAATTFAGNLTGNASGTAATVTTPAQTNITSVGTLTALTVSGGITGSIAISNYVVDTAISVSEFAAFAGKRIVYTGNACDIDLPAAVDADIGKTWVIVNASSAAITIDVDGSGTGQYVRWATGATITTSNSANRAIASGGVVELVCTKATSSANTATAPNYVIYGSGIS